MQMLVLDPRERASIYQVKESPAFKRLLDSYPDYKPVLYNKGKYEKIADLAEGAEGSVILVRRIEDNLSLTLKIQSMFNQ